MDKAGSVTNQEENLRAVVFAVSSVSSLPVIGTMSPETGMS